MNSLLLALLILRTCAIIIKTDEMGLYLSINERPREVIWSVLNFVNKSTRDTFIRLLNSPRIPLRVEFEIKYETVFGRLIRLFKAEVDSQALIFPMKTVTGKYMYWRAIREALPKYQPAIISLSPKFNTILKDGEALSLIQPLADHPERLGNFATAIEAGKMGILDAWQLYEWRTVNELLQASHKSQDWELAILGSILSMALNIKRHGHGIEELLGRNILPKQLQESVKSLLADAQKSRGYDGISDFLQLKLQGTRARWHVVWRARLLAASLAICRCGPSYSITFVSKITPEFFDTFDLHEVPLAYLKNIVRSLQSLEVHVNMDGRHLDRLFPDGRGFWGEKEEYLQRWRYRLLAYPAGRIRAWNIHNHLDIVGGFGHPESEFGYRIFTGPFITPVYVHTTMGIHECLDAKQYLEATTQRLLDSRILLGTQDLSPNDDYARNPVWRAVARLIVCNLIYRGRIGMRLEATVVERLYGNEGLSNEPSIAVMRSFLNHYGMMEFIPISILNLING